jgi:hypothetical protein
MSIEIFEPYATSDVFCEALVRIERIGCRRRLVFAVSDRSLGEGGMAIVAKLIVAADLLADLARLRCWR